MSHIESLVAFCLLSIGTSRKVWDRGLTDIFETERLTSEGVLAYVTLLAIADAEEPGAICMDLLYERDPLIIVEGL